MARDELPGLSRREREIMDVIFRAGEASVADVRRALAAPPSYSAVRATLRILVEKGHLKHKKVGQRYVYEPVLSRKSASRSALSQVVDTFFGGSAPDAVAALLDARALSEDDLERLSRLVDDARRDGR